MLQPTSGGESRSIGRRGLTQDQVTVASDIDSSNVRAYETGRAMPSIQSLVRIAEALDVTPGRSARQAHAGAVRCAGGRRSETTCALTDRATTPPICSGAGRIRFPGTDQQWCLPTGCSRLWNCATPTTTPITNSAVIARGVTGSAFSPTPCHGSPHTPLRPRTR